MNAGISVSRVGGNAQIKAMKKVASKIKLDLAQYRELASFSQFGSDVDKETKERLDHGQILMEVLRQKQYEPLDVEEQVMIIYAASNGYLKEIPIEELKNFEKEFYTFMETNHGSVKSSIRETGELTEEAEKELKSALEEFKNIKSEKTPT